MGGRQTKFNVSPGPGLLSRSGSRSGPDWDLTWTGPDLGPGPELDKKELRRSRHIWTLKDTQPYPYPVPFELEWGILGKEKPFNPVTGVCRLCLLEAYILMFDDVNTEHYP